MVQLMLLPPPSFASVKSSMVYLSGKPFWLIQVVLEKRPLNRCSAVSVYFASLHHQQFHQLWVIVMTCVAKCAELLMT